MRKHRLADVDLNLLVALDALLKERNVTRAADRLEISQSAMSHALRRLRELFKDPLLVASSRGMVPTDRALELAGPIERVLADIESTVQGESRFDPATAQRRFAIVASDYVQIVLVPRLLRHLAQHAPGIDLSFRSAGRDLALRLGEEIDLALGLFDKDLETAFRQELFREEFVCLVREGHPSVGQTLTLEQFATLSHALVAPRELKDGGVVDEALTKLGKKRRIALTVPHFLVAPLAIAESDLVLTTATRIAETFAGLFSLRILPPPLALPGFTVCQYWHERRHRDPAHNWLRSTLVELCREPSGGSAKAKPHARGAKQAPVSNEPPA